jgi:hypothetical protein
MLESGCCGRLLDGRNARRTGGQREEQRSGDRSGEDDLLHGDLPEALRVDDAVFCAQPSPEDVMAITFTKRAVTFRTLGDDHMKTFCAGRGTGRNLTKK